VKRTLEPEVMDTAEDAEGYDAMDFREPNSRFAEAALTLSKGVAAPHILDIGTGTARIPILVLFAHPRATIEAIDLAAEMLRVAQRNVRDAGLSERCKLRLVDAKSLPADERFDLVMCNSTAHHIPEPLDLFRQIALVAGDHAGILVRDLLRPETEADAWATVERVAPNDSARQKQLFFDSLCAALTLEEVEGLVRAAGLSGCTVLQVSDRHWSIERPAGSIERPRAP
jgi:ubiquinone/menaquinone biosynthesis C-methylase UbiE